MLDRGGNGTSTTAAQNNPWRYTGGYQDPGDGYYKFGARYYDAAGHFTQADNIAGSLTRPEKYNSYTYTAGDPINKIDPTGEIGFDAEQACLIGMAKSDKKLGPVSEGDAGAYWELAKGLGHGGHGGHGPFDSEAHGGGAGYHICMPGARHWQIG